MKNAIVLLGSATPAVESYFNARKNKYTLLELPHRINDVPMPHVSIVDIRGMNAKKGSEIFSPILVKKIKLALKYEKKSKKAPKKRKIKNFKGPW